MLLSTDRGVVPACFYFHRFLVLAVRLGLFRKPPHLALVENVTADRRVSISSILRKHTEGLEYLPVVVGVVQRVFAIFGDEKFLVSVWNLGGNAFKGRFAEGKDIRILGPNS